MGRLGEQTHAPLLLQTWGTRIFFKLSRELNVVPKNQETPRAFLSLGSRSLRLCDFVGSLICARFPTAATKAGSS